MDDNAINLRVYVESADDSTANRVSLQLAELMSRHGEISQNPLPIPYWKINEYWEVFVMLRPSKTVLDAFNQTLLELGTGWDVHRFPTQGDWAVWNPGVNSVFANPDVRWAHLECLRYDENE